MPTHQEIANVSDEDFVNRMVSSHDGRFDESFWTFFDEYVAPSLKKDSQILDIGCGPGLFLRDLSARYPEARLHGTDITQAMIDYGQTIDYAGNRPEYKLTDVTKDKLPVDDGQLDLLSMVAVLHVVNNPYEVCNEIRMVLSPDGVFLLQDWIRTPLPDYLERMVPDTEDDRQELVYGRLMALFTVHNKYTLQDWLWLLEKTGFVVTRHQQLGSPHFCTFVCKKA
jgi:SAM-dependent methyltransferase